MKIENYLAGIKDWLAGIKDWWVLISGGSLALIIALIIGGYSFVFSGNVEASIEYVQAYIFSVGIIKIAVYLVVAVLVFTVMFFMPAHVTLWWFEEKWQGKSRLRGFIWSLPVCIMGVLFVTLILTFLSGGYLVDPSAALRNFIYLLSVTCLFVFYFTVLGPLVLKKIGVKTKELRRSWTTGILAGLIVLIALLQPANVLLLINGGNDTGYMACVSGNRNINGKSEFFEKTVIPVSYDSRGVQVFSGNYDKKTNKWSNIRREYLYFNEGYEVKLGETCPGEAESK